MSKKKFNFKHEKIIFVKWFITSSKTFVDLLTIYHVQYQKKQKIHRAIIFRNQNFDRYENLIIFKFLIIRLFNINIWNSELYQKNRNFVDVICESEFVKIHVWYLFNFNFKIAYNFDRWKILIQTRCVLNNVLNVLNIFIHSFICRAEKWVNETIIYVHVFEIDNY